MKSKRRSFANSPFWTVLMTVVCVIYLYPIFMVFMNSLKVETAITTSGAFTLPTADTFAGLSNYANAIGAKGFLVSFGYTAFITVSSVVRLVHHAGQLRGLQGHVLSVRVLYGGPLSDGHVHPLLPGG